MDIPLPKSRLTLLPSTEDLTKTTESTSPSSHSLARNKASFYSCRATASPTPQLDQDAEVDESVYTHNQCDDEDEDEITPSPLQLWGGRTERAASFHHNNIFTPLGSSKGEDAFDSSSALHQAHRRTISGETRRNSERAKSYDCLVANETEAQRKAADKAENVEAARSRADEENEKIRGEQQQKENSETSTATAVSTSEAPNIVRKDAEKIEPIERVVTVLHEQPDGTSTPSSVVKYKTFRTYFMGIIVSMGGLIFGYGGIGQIGGFLLMEDYANRFGNETDIDGTKAFSNVRQGTIVGLLMIGALIGALIAAPITDRFGRKPCISLWAFVFAIGQVIEISAQKAWYQLVIGRVVEGLGIGGLSILTPLYMGEVAPKQIRGVMIRFVQPALANSQT
jgi:Sugar (and other) transporter